jgi:hypothetical protein
MWRRGFAVLSNERGAVGVYYGILMAILLGAMALAFDLGRLFTLNTELQNHADAAALAGAAELDGSLGARARATLAAQTGLQNTLENEQRFATDGDGMDVDVAAGGILFLRQLPPDTQEISAADLATSDADARFIRVVVEERTVDNVLSLPLIGQSPWTTNAMAIGGFSQAVCRFPPLFMCNPFESMDFPTASPECDALRGTGAPFLDECLLPGTQTLLKFVGGSQANWTPGNAGLLDPPTGNQGAINVAEQLASAQPNACYGTLVDTRTGQAVGPVKAAINVRFDMYNNPSFQNKKNDPLYRPARNVTKGHLPDGGNECKQVEAEDPIVAMPLPQDACFATDSCAGGGRFGGGNWDRDAYWDVNHDGLLKPPGYDAMSRYDVYRWEVDNGRIPDNSGDTPTGEDGEPSCYGGGTLSDPSDDPDGVGMDEIDRRVMTLAVLNCVALQQQGFSLNGNSPGLPVERFAKIFLTEPASGQGTEQADIWAEVFGTVDPGDQNSVLHDMVQLYR